MDFAKYCDKQYGNRYKTDSQVIDTISERCFDGIMGKQAEFVLDNQLMNEEDWRLFVEQFRRPVDIVDSGWRCEYFGKMMRGACMTYQYTKSEELYELLSSVAEDMLTTQDEKGRFSTYSLDRQFCGWDMWGRKYVLLGFLHFYEICRDEAFKERIMVALEKHLDYICEHIGYGQRLAVNKSSEWWGAMNSASILEPVIRMYNCTGKESYLEFANHIVDVCCNSETDIFTLALENKLYPYQYPATKAYEMMSCFEGLLEYYRLTGEEKWKTAVINFVDKVKESDITLIGCAGCEHELFNHSVATQTDTDYTGIMQETCVTVTWMKICNQLLMLTGDAKYADNIEVSAYNALYGAVNNMLCTSNGGFMFDSYSPLTKGVRGRAIGGHRNISETKYYGCCAAIGAAGTALMPLTAVTLTRNGVAINYYEKGKFNGSELSILIDTEYPADGNVCITVEKACETKQEISLRIPAFSADKTQIMINGQSEKLSLIDNSAQYVSFLREWKAGDKIEVTFSMNSRIIRPEGMPEKSKTKDFLAVLYGPLVLARDARIGGVGTPIRCGKNTDNVKLDVEPRRHDGIKCVLRADVQIKNISLDMIDYGSAGKTWDEVSLMEAWLPLEN